MPTGLTKLQKELLEVVRELELNQEGRITTQRLYDIVAERRCKRGEITSDTSHGRLYYNWYEFNVARSLRALEGRGLLHRSGYRPFWWNTGAKESPNLNDIPTEDIEAEIRRRGEL